MFFLESDAQDKGYRSKCELITAFINAKSVVDYFELDSKYSGSPLTIIDVFKSFDSCSVNKWHAKKVNIINEGPLADSLKMWEAHFVIKNRCGYFLFLGDRPGNDDYMSIIEGCSNYISTVKIIKRRKRFFLGKIENGVI